MFSVGQKVKMKAGDRWVDCEILEIDQESGSCLVSAGALQQGWTDLMSLKKFIAIDNKAERVYIEWATNEMNVWRAIEEDWKHLIVKPLKIVSMDRKLWIELDSHREFSLYPSVMEVVSLGRIDEVVGWRLNHDEDMISEHRNYFKPIQKLIVECQKLINERYWALQ